MIRNICVCYFSPTGGTKKVAKYLGEEIKNIISNEHEIDVAEIDFTKPFSRTKAYEFGEADLLLIASPVYAGRLPNKIAPFFSKCFKGESAKCVCICCYGNRDKGGALTELRLIMQNNGFDIVSAGAIVSEHPFSDKVGKGRPNHNDLDEISRFAKLTVKTIDNKININIPLNTEIPPYYVPLREDKTPAKFLKAKPITNKEKCDSCGLCAAACPVGSIDFNDCSIVKEPCIKCQACIKICPHKAKYFEDEDFLSHVRMLEENYTAPNDNIFVVNNHYDN